MSRFRRRGRHLLSTVAAPTSLAAHLRTNERRNDAVKAAIALKLWVGPDMTIEQFEASKRVKVARHLQHACTQPRADAVIGTQQLRRGRRCVQWMCSASRLEGRRADQTMKGNRRCSSCHARLGVRAGTALTLEPVERRARRTCDARGRRRYNKRSGRQVLREVNIYIYRTHLSV